ncbi:MAG: hypothetical protein ACT4PT_12645 [Methanobacteriota archaeon]
MAPSTNDGTGSSMNGSPTVRRTALLSIAMVLGTTVLASGLAAAAMTRSGESYNCQYGSDYHRRYNCGGYYTSECYYYYENGQWYRYCRYTYHPSNASTGGLNPLADAPEEVVEVVETAVHAPV